VREHRRATASLWGDYSSNQKVRGRGTQSRRQRTSRRSRNRWSTRTGTPRGSSQLASTTSGLPRAGDQAQASNDLVLARRREMGSANRAAAHRARV